MPDTSTHGTHRKCSAEVVEDYPWTFSFTQNLVDTPRSVTSSPWVSSVVGVRHGVVVVVVDVEGKNLVMAFRVQHVFRRVGRGKNAKGASTSLSFQPPTSRPLPKATMSAMVLTPRSLTVNTALSDNLKRKLQVYVEIPPSPLHTSSGSSSFAKINAFNPRKSGTPLTNKALNIDVSRKQDTLESPMKKQKLNPSGISSIALEKTSQATVATERNAKWLEKFPEGFFICHHCRQHKGLKDST